MAIDIEWQVKPPHDGEDESHQRLFPRIAKSEVIDEDALARIIEKSSPYSRGTVKALLNDIPAIMANLLREGKSISIPALGTFRLSIGTDSEVTQATASPARNVVARGVNFLPSKQFMQSIATPSFHTVARNATPKVPSAEQLFPSLTDYLSTHNSITRAEFASLFNLKRSTACARLKELVAIGVMKEIGCNKETRYVKG